MNESDVYVSDNLTNFSSFFIHLFNFVLRTGNPILFTKYKNLVEKLIAVLSHEFYLHVLSYLDLFLFPTKLFFTTLTMVRIRALTMVSMVKEAIVFPQRSKREVSTSEEAKHDHIDQV